ncbi:hypothetical protein CTAYLR_003524 [Chrysophaeum taylorii]|uniref:WASH complex subunit 3 n=1 Tax=Chrysophaeum taylorii TaxID=2483200 RepID=A0AAD7XJZ2_9STRA|nr:hypothetical protein CTAYLR_003524 [Chrysophaeum taylorii]
MEYGRKESSSPAIPQVKSVLLVNNFIANTTAFLNVFAATCEEKLSGVSDRLSDVELTLSLLEAKLNSVPGVVAEQKAEVEPFPQAEEEEEEEEEAPQDEGLIPIRSHPDYEPYFRLQKLGVPEPQIRLKMEAEGVDPAALADPDKMVQRDSS